MTRKDQLKAAVLQLNGDSFTFEQLALEVFRFQAEENLVYKTYLNYLGVNLKDILRLEQIPCLPIHFFKQHVVYSGTFVQAHLFKSSGTGGDRSTHFVTDLPFYEYISARIFEQYYGPFTDYHFFALLPGYLERKDSSLVYMLQGFIHRAMSSYSGFYLDALESMVYAMENAEDKRKLLLVGVTFALLDLAENPDLCRRIKALNSRLIVMETGGMKGRREELTRVEVHFKLCQAFGVNKIHSEYGMTELLSQGYSQGEGLFALKTPMRILLREINDPFTYLPSQAIGTTHLSQRQRSRAGGINVIDLANIDSCSFIETQDIGAYYDNYKYVKVLGRMDNSEVRGCNLMLT